MNRENAIIERLKRRLAGSRASVFLEFALIAPLAMAMLCFAADFTRILRAEQQIEIAARAAADIEIHYRPGGDADAGSAAVPCEITKTIVKNYLMDYAQVTDSISHIYLKAGVFTNRNILTAVVELINTYLFKEQTFDNIFWKIFTKLMKTVSRLLTMGCDAYITQVIPKDRGLAMTCSVALPTLMPSYFLECFGQRMDNRFIMVVQYEPDRENGDARDPLHPKTTATSDFSNGLKTDARHRYWVTMPILDTAPIAPETYTRQLRQWPIIKPFL